MGQKLCCLRPPTTENQPRRNRKEAAKRSLSNDGLLGEVGSSVMTLEDYLIRSPALNPPQGIRAGEISVLKQPNNRVHPSSPDLEGTHFYTPRMSFSSGCRRLEKIDELIGEEGEEEVPGKPLTTSSSSSRRRRPSLKKRVTFKLPHEADVIVFYSPKETFDPMSDS